MLSHPEHVRSRGQKAQATGTAAVGADAGAEVQKDCKHSCGGAAVPETTGKRQQIV
jgi:hypothetical protein